MNPKNIEGTTKLAKAFKEKFPNKNLWAWSGFSFDKELKDKEVVKYLDVLVDGQYIDELHNPTLQWKGSENQRVIDVQDTKNKKNGKNEKILCLYFCFLPENDFTAESQYSRIQSQLYQIH